MVNYSKLSENEQKKYDKLWDKIKKIYEFNRDKSDKYKINKISKLKFKNKPLGKKKATIILEKITKNDSECY